MIVSMIDGRMRIRHLRLKKRAFADEFKRHLSADKGLKEVLINLRVGSALLIYDASIISAERIIKRISKFLGITQETEIPKDRKININPIRKLSLSKINTRKAISIGLAASLTASLIALIFGSKVLHVAFGLVFLGFAAVHILKYKKLLLA